jgi:hypothetical protein
MHKPSFHRTCILACSYDGTVTSLQCLLALGVKRCVCLWLLGTQTIHQFLQEGKQDLPFFPFQIAM